MPVWWPDYSAEPRMISVGEVGSARTLVPTSTPPTRSVRDTITIGEAALDYGNVAEAALELEALAMALAAQGRREEAVRLGAAAAIRMADLGFDTSGVAWWSQLKERFLGSAVAALDEPVATALAAAGRAMGWDAARVEALAASRR